jgi:hypothetical protein
MRQFIINIFLTITLLAAVSNAAKAGNEPRLATKLGLDSTIFSMEIGPDQTPKAGGTFKVKIHVTPHGDWHVYSAKMSSEGGLTPLTIAVPPDIADYFKIAGIEETGDIRTGYDSNFMATTMAHYTPYDIVVTVTVLKKSADKIPFYLFLHYQTCNETMCMPPRTFAVPMTVIGQQPLKLTIAQVVTNKDASKSICVVGAHCGAKFETN